MCDTSRSLYALNISKFIVGCWSSPLAAPTVTLTFILSTLSLGTQWGCAERVALGSVPNEHGTWQYGRAGWCDGQQVGHSCYPVFVLSLARTLTLSLNLTLVVQCDECCLRASGCCDPASVVVPDGLALQNTMQHETLFCAGVVIVLLERSCCHGAARM